MISFLHAKLQIIADYRNKTHDVTEANTGFSKHLDMDPLRPSEPNDLHQVLTNDEHSSQYPQNCKSLSLSLRFNSHLPGELGLAGVH